MKIACMMALVWALLIPVRGFADSKNQANRGKLSSEAIVTFVLSCEDKAKKNAVYLSQLLILIYCSCVADFYRETGKNPDMKTLTYCADYAKKRIERRKKK